MDAAAKQHEREHLVAELFGGDPATEALDRPVAAHT